ncbi:MAG TPA: ATP-binding cassette domain-containing protein [bacterium]
MKETILEAISVSKTFDGNVQALKNINLTVSRGETVVLIGESGCGKSTLIRTFNRLVEPTSGAIKVFGDEVKKQAPVQLRRKIGYMQQGGGLIPHWNIQKNVALVPAILGWDSTRKKKRCDELLEFVGIDPGKYSGRYPSELSGGQRQRVAFARAIAADPDVVLLDEPFGALDAITRVEIRDEFANLKNQLNKTILLVTHDLTTAFVLGDRIVVMKEGIIEQDTDAAELKNNPESGYVAELVSHHMGGVS